MNPGSVDVVVYPPLSVADWTLEDLPERIEEVRQLYVDTKRMLRKGLENYVDKSEYVSETQQAALNRLREKGLTEAEKILRNVEGIRFCYFTDQDVVRHPLVQEVIRAYDAYERPKS